MCCQSKRNSELTKRTYRKHFIGLVKNEHLHGVGLQETTLDHILDTSRSTNDNLRAFLESLHIITNAGTTNAGVALDVHEVTDGNHNFLDLLSQFTSGCKDQGLALLDVGIKLLEDRDGESGSLSGSRLCLSNDIVAFETSLVYRFEESRIRQLTLDNWHDSALLDSRRALETVGVNTCM
jgi:hypothetical protein